MSLPSSSDVRAASRLEDDETRQFLNVLEWARRNPLKDVEILVLSPEERDRIRALLHTLNGEAALPGKIQVQVRPDDYRDPVHVRT